MLVGEQIAEAVFVCPPRSRQTAVARSNDDRTTSGHLQVTVRLWAGKFKKSDRQEGNMTQWNHKKVKVLLRSFLDEGKQTGRIYA